MIGLASRSLAGILTFALTATVAVAATPDPLRFIPENYDLVIKVEQPRKLAESLLHHPAADELQRLDAVRQALDSAQARKFFQLVKYYEQDLGHPWLQLIDKLAGGGMVLGVKYVNEADDLALVAIQSTDAALLKKFMDRVNGVLQQELSNPEAKSLFARGKYKDFETWKLDKNAHLALVDDVLLFSPQEAELKGAIDRCVQQGKMPAASMLDRKSLADAKKLLPENPLLWAYFDLKYAKEQPEAKDIFASPRNDPIQTVLFAGWLDIIGRSAHVIAGLYHEKNQFQLTVRMPAGREGRAPDVVLHLPDDAKATSMLPLLQPKGVMFSHSFYLDLGAIWEKRTKIFNEKTAKDLESGVQQGSRVLPGASIDKLLMQSGVYHRLIAAQPTKLPYRIEPGVRLPGFAFVMSMRDPAFAKNVELLIRGGAALAAAAQIKLKDFEEQVGDVRVFGYRFPEDASFPNDAQNIRYNFVPCFAAVRDQFIFCSNRELIEELILLIQKEDRSKKYTSNMQMTFTAKGIGAFLNSSPEQLLTQTILSQAVSEAEAKKQVEALLTYIDMLGSLQLTTDYAAKTFRFDITWRYGK